MDANVATEIGVLKQDVQKLNLDIQEKQKMQKKRGE